MINGPTQYLLYS